MKQIFPIDIERYFDINGNSVLVLSLERITLSNLKKNFGGTEV
jgi:hypothetical protein